MVYVTLCDRAFISCAIQSFLILIHPLSDRGAVDTPRKFSQG